MQYCHICAEWNLRSDLASRGFRHEIVSDIQNECFNINLDQSYRISVKFMTVSYGGRNDLFKDWDLFLRHIKQLTE